MKAFLAGIVVGGAIASAAFWIANRPEYIVPPNKPFNINGVYRIRQTSDYLILNREEDGLNVEVRRSYDSTSGTGFDAVSLPKNWIRSERWFAYIDEEYRIWLFDGIADLKVVVRRDDGATFDEPSSFKCPEVLMGRLSRDVMSRHWPEIPK